jgi:predicted transposase/invertase (TIGR01784 family)
MQFVDIKNDIAFRKIFGNENKKIILISFLNAIMKLKDNNVIVDIEILNPYQLPIIKNLKASIIDLKARDKKGKTYIIEMQVAEPDGLDKRLLYYASKEYSQQIESGEFYTKLKPVIFIGIFDFNFTERGKYLSHHAVCDVESGERTIKDMDFYFIELPKFVKSLLDLTEVTDKWIYFIKEAENLDVIPPNLDDEGLKEAYADANKHSWTKEELDAYDYAAMRDQDERGRMELAEKKAEKRGKDKMMNEAILGFNKIGLSNEKIAEALNISIVEVRDVIENK